MIVNIQNLSIWVLISGLEILVNYILSRINSRKIQSLFKVTEAVQCQLKEYGYRIYLESQSFIDRVTEINKLNESH